MSRFSDMGLDHYKPGKSYIVDLHSKGPYTSFCEVTCIPISEVDSTNGSLLL
jgi:hypothetical protein